MVIHIFCMFNTFHSGIFYTDFLAPTISSSSITATSVTIIWSQPEGSLAADNYTISLQQLTGNNRQLCPTNMDSRIINTTTTSMSFTNLQEFSIYTVTVTARVFGTSKTSIPHEFTTTSAGTYSCMDDNYSWLAFMSYVHVSMQ